MEGLPLRRRIRRKTRKCLRWFRKSPVLRGCASISCLIGLGFGLTGVLMRLKKLPFLNELTDIASREANKKFTSTHVDIPEIFPASYKEIKGHHYSIEVLGGTASICLQVLGGIFTGVSCWGMTIGEKSSVEVLKWYTAIICFLTLGFLTLFLCSHRIIIHDMRKTLHDYKGITDTSLAGITWNTMMLGLHCCGVEGNDEFHTLTSWPPGDLEGHTFDREKALSILKIPQDVDNFTAELEKWSCRVTNATGDVSCLWMDTAFFYTPMACCKSMDYIVKGCHLLDTSNVGNNWKMVGCERRVNEYLSKQTHIYVIFAFLLVFYTSYCAVMMYSVFGKIEEEQEEIDRTVYYKSMASRHSEVTLDTLQRLATRLSVNPSAADISLISVHQDRRPLSRASQHSLLVPKVVVSSEPATDGEVSRESKANDLGNSSPGANIT